MYSKINYTTIGLFVVLFIMAIIAFAFWLGNKGLQDNYTLYLLRMSESVTGLSKDSGIKMKGVDIGSISSISINPQNIEEVDIILKIKNNIPIKEDMLGVVKMYGLTGLSYIEIKGGTNSAKTLEAIDNQLPQIKAGISLLTKLENNVGSLMDEFVVVLNRTEKVLSSKNIENFSKVLSNLDKVTSKAIELENQSIKTLSKAEEGIADFRVSIKKLTKDFSTMNSNFNTLTIDFHQDIQPAMKGFLQMSKSVDQMVTTFEKSINRGDYNMQKVMTPMMIDIRELSIGMEEVVSQLGQSPNDIIFKSTKPRRGPGE